MNRQKINQLILALVQGKTQMRNGAACVFFRLNKTVGIKLYSSKASQQFAFSHQRIAHRLKMAPRAIGLVNLTSKETDHLVSVTANMYIKKYTFGYLTQTVATSKYISKSHFDALIRKMKRYGFRTADIGRGHNTAMLNGVAVCYDFEPISMAHKVRD